MNDNSNPSRDELRQLLSEDMFRVVDSLHLMGQIALDDAMRYHGEQIFAKRVFGQVVEQMLQYTCYGKECGKESEHEES